MFLSQFNRLPSTPFRAARRQFGWIVVVAGVCYVPRSAVGQTVVPAAPGGDEAAAIAGANHGTDTLGSEAAQKQPAFLHWGPFGFRPAFDYSLMHESGLQVSAGRPATTYITTITAGAQMDIGNNWSASYLPSWVRYSHAGFTDSFDQNFSLNGQVANPNWTGTVSEQYTKVNAPMVETARQTGEQTSATTGTLNYFFGHGLGLQLEGQQNLKFVKGLADTYEWSVTPELTYQPFSRVTIGGGAGLGYVLVYHAPDMEYIRPVTHLTWLTTTKTALSLDVGMDRWRFVSGHHGQLKGFYYQASAKYSPFEQTTFTFALERQNSTTPFQAQMSRTQGESVTLDQRLLTHFHLALEADDQRTSYFVDGATLAQARGDRLRTYSAKLSANVLRRGSISLIYRVSKNGSSASGFQFAIHEVGIEVGFHY